MASYFFFFKQKTAYEMRISDWSSDVCSSDLPDGGSRPRPSRSCRSSRGGCWGLRSLLSSRLARAIRAAVGNARGAPPESLYHLCPAHRQHRRAAPLLGLGPRRRPHNSEERRVGTGCVSTFRFRWSPYHNKNKEVQIK